MSGPCICLCEDCRSRRKPAPIPAGCRRCDSFTHERVCAVCGFEPACHDHNCWATKELEEAS